MSKLLALKKHRGLHLLFIVYIILALAFSLIVPLSKAPDEYVHFLYTRFLIDQKRPPINFEEQQSAGYKSDQPPLYYSIVALVTSPIDVSEPPVFKFSWEPLSRQLIDIVLPHALLIHTEDETWPFKGLYLVWFVGRWVSIVLSSLTLIITYFTALEIFPKQRWLALAAAGVLAFMPRFIFIGSVLSDDNMVGLLMALFLYAVIRPFKYNPRVLLTYALMGGLVGLAFSTKYTVLPVPFEVFLLTLWLAWLRRWSWRLALGRLAAFGLTMAVVASVWFGFMWSHFNQIQEYGLIMGLLKPIMAGGNNPQETAAILTTVSGGGAAASFPEGNFWDWLSFLFTQFWDVPIAGVPQPYPLVVVLILAAILCLLAGFGWWRRWQLNEGQQRIWLGVFTFHMLIFVPIPLIRFIAIGDIHDTAQARHVLFPAASAIAILLVAGVVAVFPQKWKKVAAFAVTGFVLILTLEHLYYYLIGFPPPLPVRTDPTAASTPKTLLSVEFADGLVLRGYDWRLSHNQVLELNLHWRSEALTHVDYRTEITLRDSQGVDQLHWLSHPADGRFPTRAWDVGDSVRDTLNIPLVGVSSGVYEIILRLLDWDNVPLQSTRGDAIALFSLSIDPPASTPSAALWQNGQVVSSPTYRYRATIPLTGLSGQNVSLIDPGGQTHLPLTNVGHLRLFMVDYDWPSGEYRVRVDGRDTELGLRVENFEWNFSSPEMAQTVNVDFNDEIRLLGYDLPSRRVEAGGGVPLVLYWQSLRRMTNSYIIFDRLLDNQQQSWGGYDRLPKETYPTNLWVPGEVVADGFAIPIDSAAPDGIYNIVVGLYDEVDPTAQSLPLFQAGQHLETTSVMIGPIKVGGPPPGVVLSEQAVSSPDTSLFVRLGDPPVILLRGYDLAQEDGALRLSLYWESLAQTPIDWTIFVHLRNEAGETVAQKDGAAGSGLYPTSLWDPNEIIVDEVVVPTENIFVDSYSLNGSKFARSGLPSVANPDQNRDLSISLEQKLNLLSLFVGLYDLTTGRRLFVPGNSNDEILLK